MRTVMVGFCTALLLPGLGLAATKTRGMQFWNLTGETLTEVALAPAGSAAFGANQCANDKDGTVDFDEDLPLKSVSPGRYDMRLKDDRGRTCYARNIEVKADETVSVRDKDLVDCDR